MSAKVFLSYSAADKRLASAVVEALKARRVSTWSDKEAIQAGSTWRAQIYDALGAASVIVAILSKRSVRSPWLHFEVGAAFSTGKPVVAVLVGKTKPTDIPDWLQSLQYIDVRGLSLKHAADEIADRVLRLQAG